MSMFDRLLGFDLVEDLTETTWWTEPQSFGDSRKVVLTSKPSTSRLPPLALKRTPIWSEPALNDLCAAHERGDDSARTLKRGS